MGGGEEGLVAPAGEGRASARDGGGGGVGTGRDDGRLPRIEVCRLICAVYDGGGGVDPAAGTSSVSMETRARGGGRPSGF